MNVEFINPFIIATVNALTTMAFIAPKRGQPQIRKDEPPNGADISAVIGLTGETNGWVAICLQKSVALNIAGNMLGVQKSYIDADVRDAVGEIVNMIAGGAKAELAKKGFSFKIAIPTVVVGDNHQLGQSKNSVYLVIPFETEHGSFYVNVCLESEVKRGLRS
jgi:chemotaxis protein CheX